MDHMYTHQLFQWNVQTYCIIILYVIIKPCCCETFAQRFALRMCCKNWNEPYDALLARTDLPTLSKRRKFLKVSYFFQVISGTFHSPNAPITTHPTDTRNSSTTALKPIFAEHTLTNFPNTISLWNNLPDVVGACSSLQTFKYYVWDYL